MTVPLDGAQAVRNAESTAAPAQVHQPRRPGRLTGEKLGNKVELAQALLNSGVSKSKVAGNLKKMNLWK